MTEPSHALEAPPANGFQLRLRAGSLNPLLDGEYYSACYADAWTAAHGSLKGFNPRIYLKSAYEHYLADPMSVLKIFDGDVPAGLLELDTLRGTAAGIGWISFLYLKEEYRGCGLGDLLLNEAVSRYLQLGRTSVRLHAAADNTRALAFYKRNGFRVISAEQNSLGVLLLLEKELQSQHTV